MTDTLNFFHTITPPVGVHFLAEPYRKRDGSESFRHFPFESLDQMAQAVGQFNEQGRTIFHACASFREVIQRVSEGGYRYAAGRHASNVLAVKSLWEDIDVRKTTVPSYDAQRDACRDLTRCCRAIGLPLPMIVSSGVGLHLYWPFAEPTDLASWLVLARLKKHCLRHSGLRIDPSRTADAASILRPVGAKRMVKGELRVVRILLATDPIDHNELHDRFARYAREHGLVTAASKSPTGVVGSLGELERRKIESALAAIDSNDYQAWIRTGMCLVALREHLGDDAERLWLDFSDRAADSAKRNNDCPSTAPELMFARMTPSMTAEAALGTLLSLAKESAITAAKTDIQARRLTKRGKTAVQHLVRFHPRAWAEIQQQFGRTM